MGKGFFTVDKPAYVSNRAQQPAEPEAISHAS